MPATPDASPWADLCEVLVRLGRRDEARTMSETFAPVVGVGDHHWVAALRERSAGLLASEEQFDEHFDAALTHQRTSRTRSSWPEPDSPTASGCDVPADASTRASSCVRLSRPSTASAPGRGPSARPVSYARPVRPRVGDSRRRRGADAPGAPDRAPGRRGEDEQGGGRGALPQPEDGRVPPHARLSQARRPLPGRADQALRGRRACARTRLTTWTPTPPACASSGTSRAPPRPPWPRQRHAGLRDDLAGRRPVRRVRGRAGRRWACVGWVLPVALLGQCLLLVVYSELAAEYRSPTGSTSGAGGCSARRTAGSPAGSCCARTPSPARRLPTWGRHGRLALVGVEPSPAAIVAAGAVIVLACSLINACGVDVLRRAINAGVAAELVASVGVGVTLLLVFREHGFSLTTEMLGAQTAFGSQAAAMLAALAVAGWVFIGFDARVAAAEETKGAARHPARALDRTAQRRGDRHPQRRRRHAGPSRSRRRGAPRRHRPRRNSRRELLRGLVEPTLRRRRPRRLRRLRHGGSGHDGARHLLLRARRRAARIRVSRGSRPPRRADRRADGRDCRRLARAPAGARVPGDRQHDRLRHGGDLRLLPPLVALAALLARVRGSWRPLGGIRSAAPLS